MKKTRNLLYVIQDFLQYYAETGKRIKKPYAHVSWVHTELDIPEYIWLASGGKNGCFNEQNFDVLKGRNIVLFPDIGMTQECSFFAKIRLSVADLHWTKWKNVQRYYHSNVPYWRGIS